MTERMDAIIRRLNRQGNDDDLIEAKSGSGKLDKGFWSTVSAFANTRGGTIVMGVEENQEAGTFHVNADFDYHRLGDQLIDAFREGQEKPAVEPMPKTRIEADEFEGAPVILIQVFPMREDPKLGKRMPCYVVSQGPKTGAYKRVLDGDQRLSTYEVFQLSTLFEEDFSELSPVPTATLSDLDRVACLNLIDSYVKSGSRLMYGTTGEAEGLERLHVLDSNGQPTLAGMLALGDYPQQFYPQLFIDVAVHPEAEKSAGETRFLSRTHCDGPLPQAVETAIQSVMSQLRTRSVERGGAMIDEPEIPEITIREAVVNAVMHRDYSPQVQGRQVQVDVYPDRVEINNPGGLWGDRTVENLDENRSASRNKYLSNLLSNLPTPNGSARVAENQGSGIQRMRIGMRRQGLPQPEFRARISDFTVILYRFGLLTPEISEWLGEFAPNAGHEEQVALAIAHGFGGVSAGDLRSHLGLDSDDAREVLGGLRAAGLLNSTEDPDRFVMQAPAPAIAGDDQAVIDALAQAEELSARDIADRTGSTVVAIRPRLRRLVDQGAIVATAPPTSRYRRYRLP